LTIRDDPIQDEHSLGRVCWVFDDPKSYSVLYRERLRLTTVLKGISGEQAEFTAGACD
jgi:hypothetical protein